MRYDGRISDWNDDRGFGFVSSSDGGRRAFVHIKAFERAARRPVAGDLVSYELQQDEQGRAQAAKIRFIASQAITRPARMSLPRKSIGAIFLFMLVVGSLFSMVPKLIVLTYVAMSIFAVLFYAIDKDAAINGSWRVKESTLHFIALLGGWPGALFAQDALRHKTKKASFQGSFWTIVALNCCALAWLSIDGRVEAFSRNVVGF
jgi:uncharacterized membrane protein YsdA (DUF1294 family)/cold shock CspA family protein